jgi:hypothetical protein
MKQSLKFYTIRTFFLLMFIQVFQLVMFAQEQTGGSESKETTTSSTKTNIDVSSSTNTAEWYASPWVWIIGAAVFILLLVALLSNRGADRTVTTNSDRVVVKKTVERDTDTTV